MNISGSIVTAKIYQMARNKLYGYIVTLHADEKFIKIIETIIPYRPRIAAKQTM